MVTKPLSSLGGGGRRCCALLPVLGVLTTASLAAMAQDDAAVTRRGPFIVPSISVTQTLTNNVEPNAGKPRSDAITQVTPGLRLSTRSGRLEADVNYSLSGVFYARRDDANNFQQNLAARLKAALIEDFAFIESRASISQHSISALGVQTSGNELVNDNRTEVSTFLVSPFLHGRFGRIADYDARLTHSLTRSSASQNGDSNSTSGVFRMNSSSATSSLGWFTDLSGQSVDYSAGRETKLVRLIGGLSYQATPDLLLSVRGGRESSDLLTGRREQYSTSGWGVNWEPTDRTVIAYERDRRFFGKSYSFRLEHRTPRTVWRVSSSRGVNFDPLGAGAAAGTATLYDLLFQQFASEAPDPAQRAVLVNEYLRIRGWSGDSLAQGGLLASAATQDRRSELSFALLGRRNSVVTVIYSGVTQRLGVSSAVDDLSGGREIRQRGAGVTASHRLTPSSTMNLGLNVQRSNSSQGGDDNRMRSVILGWSGQTGLRSSVSISARRALFQSAARPYSESALLGTYSLTF